MKRQILTIIITFAIAVALLGGSRAPAPIQPTTVEAQTAGGKSDLISRTVQWARDCKKLDDDGQSITNTWNTISSTITSPTDFTGSSAGLTKTQMTAVITTVGNMHTTYIAGNNTNVETFK